MSLSSILSRPPKISPTKSLVIGLVLIPLGAVIQGLPGGVLLGIGLGLLLTAAWDFGRLRFMAWWRGRQSRKERDSSEAPRHP
jgi:hypothetical protein